MPLIDLTTDLKSLKYGQDRPGGGNSGQPYIQNDINNPKDILGFDDGLVRGGIVGATKASLKDSIRIGKWLKDLYSRGPLWAIKQLGLQRSNPKLETRPGAGRILGEPTRIYNALGTNTLVQVKVNAFGQHFNRHGLLLTQPENTKYLAVAQANNQNFGKDNRLVLLANKFSLGRNNNISLNNRESGLLFFNLFTAGADTANFAFNDILQPIRTSKINDYLGGPGSIYGLGRTLIPRTPERTGDRSRIDLAINQSKIWAGNAHSDQGPVKIQLTGNNILYPISSNYTNSDYAPTEFGSLNTADTNLRSTLIDRRPSSNDKTASGEKANAAFTDVSNKIRNREFLGVSTNFMSKYSKDKFENNGEAILRNDANQPDSLDDNTITTYQSTLKNAILGSNNITSSLGSGSYAIKTYGDGVPTDPNELIKGIDKNAVFYTTPAAKTYAELKSKIKTNISQKAASNNNTFTTDPATVNRSVANFIYNSVVKTKFNRPNDLNIESDTMALVFEPLDPFTGNILDTIKFLGYIASYNDSFSSTWNSIKYVGRAEKFYIFNEFKRNNTLGFQIPCYNKSELTKKHADLNKLSSILAGTYDGNGLLGGVISKITIGNYVYKQPSIIDTLSFSPIEGTSWDLDDKLAFYLKVDIGFTVIHNFLPQYGANFINV
jgi:hypothetical protein